MPQAFGGLFSKHELGLSQSELGEGLKLGWWHSKLLRSNFHVPDMSS
jgi:hypothetical protein